MVAADWRKPALERVAALLVKPAAWSFWIRRRFVGEELAHMHLSESAARWPGVLGGLLRRELHRRIGASIGDGVILRFGCVLKRPPLSIGAFTAIGHYAIVQHARIGAESIVGDGVMIFDGSRQHDLDRFDIPLRDRGGTWQQVAIGDDCLIGAGAVILADVGDHCVVGAGSVVTKPVPDFKIVVGSPARVIGDRRERSLPSGDALLAGGAEVEEGPV
jgi:acetyltransferase-like isoleucine patch superfamily enzyme